MSAALEKKFHWISLPCSSIDLGCTGSCVLSNKSSRNRHGCKGLYLREGLHGCMASLLVPAR